MLSNQQEQSSPSPESVNIQLNQFFEFLAKFEEDKAEAKKLRIRKFTQETVDFYIRYATDILRNLPPMVKGMKLREFRDKY